MLPQLFLCISSLIACSQAQDASPVVDLGYAKYQGSFDQSIDITSFLGMKYAAPPMGSLRWQAPQDPLPVSELQIASDLGPGCLQASSSGISSTNPYTGADAKIAALNVSTEDRAVATNSEDCLSLSVYTPGLLDPSNVTELLPVVFWIHGGGYIVGRGGDHGEDLVRESAYGTVAVVIQYRLGLFGFLAGQAVKDDGALNAGLLDQQFALEWTQKHIAKFGGDPARVTMWGESAGAGSVLQQVIANDGKTSPPLFRAAITSSTFLPSQYHFNDTIPEQLYSLAVEQASCSLSPDPLSCLRDTDSAALENINNAVNVAGFFGTFVTVPVVDGTFITERPIVAMKKGKVNGQVILSVTNTDEGSPFVDQSTAETVLVTEYLANLFPRLSSKNIELGAAVYAGVGSAIEQVIAIMNESIFVCPTYFIMEAFRGASFKGQFAIPPATHGQDIPYYFPSIGIEPTFTNPDFITAFVASFTAFIMDLNPNEKFEPTITPAWKHWTPTGQTEMLFNKTEVDDPLIKPFNTSISLLERCAFWEAVGTETGQ